MKVKNAYRFAVLTNGTVLEDVIKDRFAGYDTSVWFVTKDGDQAAPRTSIVLLTDNDPRSWSEPSPGRVT